MEKHEANKIIHTHFHLMNKCVHEKTEPFTACWVEVQKCTACGCENPSIIPNYTGAEYEAVKLLTSGIVHNVDRVFLTSCNAWGWQAFSGKRQTAVMDFKLASAISPDFCIAICTAALRSIGITEEIEA